MAGATEGVGAVGWASATPSEKSKIAAETCSLDFMVVMGFTFLFILH